MHRQGISPLLNNLIQAPHTVVYFFFLLCGAKSAKLTNSTKSAKSPLYSHTITGSLEVCDWRFDAVENRIKSATRGGIGVRFLPDLVPAMANHHKIQRQPPCEPIPAVFSVSLPLTTRVFVLLSTHNPGRLTDFSGG